MPRPKLLFLSHRLPYPPHNGAAIRTFNILKQLARSFDIQALCFDREDTATRNLPLEDRVAALREFAAVEVFPIEQQQSRTRLVWDHLRSVVTHRAYTYYLHESADFERRLQSHLSGGNWSLAHLDSLDLLRFLPRVERLPIVCTHHNVESALLRRRAVAEPSFLVRRYMRHQANLLEAAERDSLGRVALNVAVSEDDAEHFRRMRRDARVIVVPNGVDTDFFRPVALPQHGAVFVGGTSWFPNKDALRWFGEAIQPELERQGWTEGVTWVGRATEEEKAQFGGIPGLRVTGYVDDIRPYVHGASCFIAPLRVGGGTRLKILDAWAMGKAVVSTTIGCEGLRTEPDRNILVADTPRDFASAMNRLANDASTRQRIGTNARATVEAHYSWDIIGEAMRQEYLTLVGTAQVVAEGKSG